MSGSAATIRESVDESVYFEIFPAEQEVPEPATVRAAERWYIEDPVDELVGVVERTGRVDELLQRLMPEDASVEEDAARAYVTRLWSEEWNSPEDSVYDEES